jgi:rhomboid protease GluP
MAGGISPRKIAVIPLGEYNANYYLTLIYHAFNNLGWRIGYFDRDGIIAYTNISWESYAEEVSVRIVNNQAIIKSECVGYQFFFTDYGKNQKNLELLFAEIEYVEFHLQANLHETTQELMDSVPDRQFISIDNPPMGYKEKLHSFLAVFTPAKGYMVTPLLVLINIAVFLVTRAIMIALYIVLFWSVAMQFHSDPTQRLTHGIENIYLALGFSSRNQVLNGQVWRLITSTFLHFSIMHILGNMIVLIYIGSLLEGKLGKWNYLILYLLAGICASITSVVWNDHGIMAGASGAIFGLFGILLALLSTDFYERNARRALLISTAIFVAYSIIPLGRGIDHAAHFGGLVAGYVLGWIAYLGLKYQQQKLVTVGALALTIIYTSLCIRFAPVYQLKEMRRLTRQSEKVSGNLTRDFYSSYGIAHNERLALFRQNMIPEMDTLKHIAQTLRHINLPTQKKKIAIIQSNLLLNECRLYMLLYLEFRDNDPVKYRGEINSTTQKLNDIRLEWGKAGDDDDGDDY